MGQSVLPIAPHRHMPNSNNPVPDYHSVYHQYHPIDNNKNNPTSTITNSNPNATNTITAPKARATNAPTPTTAKEKIRETPFTPSLTTDRPQHLNTNNRGENASGFQR